MSSRAVFSFPVVAAVRILWVENHDVFVRMAGKQFFGGHDLTVVPSVATAKAALLGAAFDAVLIDYDLDDGKGTEVVALIRQLDLRPRVVAVSAHEGGNAALLAAGADGACPKTRFAGIEAALRCNDGTGVPPVWTGGTPVPPDQARLKS